MVNIDLVPWLIGLFIIAALMRIDFYFSILYIFLGLFFLGRLWTTTSMMHLKAQRRLVKRAFPGDEISYNNNLVVFTPRGFGSDGYVYIQNQDQTAFAVGTPITGAIRLFRWKGTNWE